MAGHTDNRALRFRFPLIACLALVIGGCGGPLSTGELIELTKSKDSSDRVRAVQKLGERETEADVVVPVLIEAMKDQDAFVRRDAARGLGRIGPPAAAAVPALRGAAKDKNQHVREAVADTLRKVAPDLPPETKKR